MKLQSKKIAAVLVFATVIGCNSSGQLPKDIIPTDKMVLIVAELQLIEADVARMNLQSYDSSKVAFQYLQQKVLKEYDVDSAYYRKSYEAYARYPAYLDEIYVEAIQLMEARRDSSRKYPTVPSDQNPPL